METAHKIVSALLEAISVHVTMVTVLLLITRLAMVSLNVHVLRNDCGIATAFKRHVHANSILV